ncbi:MAG: hypothetical protein OXH15_23000 [Gammaproteobacteria bacterium]|nr:hypothetical protein [Gammaproteobacteria bacterium]
MTIQEDERVVGRRALRNGLSALRRRFSNNVNVIQTAAGVERLSGKSLHANWIVGRGLCLYRCEDFANVPKNRRRAAMELRIPVWSPFEHTGHHCVWSGGTAMVWLWNADAVAQANGGPGAQPDAQREVPETIFLPRRSDGIYLQACQHGFDLQHWRDGVLHDSSWSADTPTTGDLTDFGLRQGGPAPEGEVAPSPAVLSPDPWVTPVSPADWLVANERTLVATGLAALLLAAVWLEARIWHTHWEAKAASTELARLEDELGPLLAERAEFLRLRQVNEGLAAFLTEPSQAYLMSVVDRAIPTESATFQRWSYQQRDLTVVVEDPALDPITYIESLEKEALLTGVRTALTSDADRLEITLQVQP